MTAHVCFSIIFTLSAMRLGNNLYNPNDEAGVGTTFICFLVSGFALANAYFGITARLAVMMS